MAPTLYAKKLNIWIIVDNDELWERIKKKYRFDFKFPRRMLINEKTSDQGANKCFFFFFLIKWLSAISENSAIHR